MRHLLAVGLVVLVLMVGTFLEIKRPGGEADVAYAQSDSEPRIIFSGLPLPSGVRYNVSVIVPRDVGLVNPRIEVALPAGARVVQVLETPGRTAFHDEAGDTLIWVAGQYSSGDPIDPFAFLLDEPLSAPAQIRLSWGPQDARRALERSLQPTLFSAATTAQATALLSERSGEAYAAVGETGVQLSVATGAAGGQDELRFVRLGAEANPPAGVGSPWWCAALTLDGLAPGQEALVLVPARQPLPGGITVSLFAEREGSWVELQQRGQATADGQFVGFSHPGGQVAAGIQPPFQPILRNLPAFATRTPTPAPIIFVNPPVVAPTQIGGLVAFPTSTPTRTPTPLPTATRTPTPVPTPRLDISFTSGAFFVESFGNYEWDLSLNNIGPFGSAASRVAVILEGPSSPVDWISFTTGESAWDCVVTQGVAVFGTTRARCTKERVSDQDIVNFTLRGSTGPVVGSGNRTIKATASDNFPNPPTVSHSATFTYAVNPP